MKSPLHFLLAAFFCLIGITEFILTANLYAQTAPFTTATFRTIREAKQQAFGTVLYVAGRVTIANEFGPQVHFQDGTGGMIVFDAAVSRGVALGDSIEVSGPFTEFQPRAGSPGTGLAQISGAGRVIFRVIPSARVIPVAREVALSELTGMRGEELEGQLLRVSGVQFRDTGSFRGGTNYVIFDQTTTAQVRITAGTSLINQRIPRGNLSFVAALGQFQGTYQLLPRTAADLGIILMPNPADTIAKARTLDITTLNLRWFGRPFDNDGVTRLGPPDSLLQFRNTIRVLDSIDADLYALQEIANTPLFLRILDVLPRYGAVVADFAPAQPQFVPQRTAFLFKRSVIDTVRTEMVLTNTRFAAGRFPFRLEATATVQGVSRRINAFVIHANAGSTQRDYDFRVSDAQALYEFLNTNFPTQNVILAGDFNDTPIASIFQGMPSPYLPFVRDSVRYSFVTADLARQGLSSFASGGMIDHIVVSNEMSASIVPGGARVEAPFTYITGYAATTSDHFPVTARFFLDRVTSVRSERQLRESNELRISPNPASDIAQIRLFSKHSEDAEIRITDVLGKTLIQSTIRLSANEEKISLLDVSSLPKGVYSCRLRSDSGKEWRSVFIVR